jgi:hypothetical protein
MVAELAKREFTTVKIVIVRVDRYRKAAVACFSRGVVAVRRQGAAIGHVIAGNTVFLSFGRAVGERFFDFGHHAPQHLVVQRGAQGCVAHLYIALFNIQAYAVLAVSFP